MSVPIAASVLATEPHEPAEQGGHNQEPDPPGVRLIGLAKASITTIDATGAGMSEIIQPLPCDRSGGVTVPSWSEPISGHGDQPTLPSSEIEISFCASTANSIGNCCRPSLTTPLNTTSG